MQTYGKSDKNNPWLLVILFQHRVLQASKLRCLCELSVLFFGGFSYKKPGSGHQVVQSGDQGKEDEEYRSYQEGAIKGAGEKDDTDHEGVDGDKDKCNRQV